MLLNAADVSAGSTAELILTDSAGNTAESADFTIEPSCEYPSVSSLELFSNRWIIYSGRQLPVGMLR